MIGCDNRAFQDITLTSAVRVNEEGSSGYIHQEGFPPPPYIPPNEIVIGGEDPSGCRRICCCGEGYTKVWRAITSSPLCPAWLDTSRFFALAVLVLVVWGAVFAELGDMAGPEGQLFKIGLLGVTAYIAGILMSLLGLPSLLGMMIMGIVLRNIKFVVITGPFLKVTAALRETALALILLRAGLELDPSALRRLGWMVVKMVVVPAVAETIFIAVTTYYLMGLPWIWGFLLGALLAAVSPAVVIPCLYQLQTAGNYGKEKGIPTLIIAASSFDDVLCISIFGVLLGVITSTGNITSQIIEGPVGLLIGLASGAALGMILRYVPSEDDERATMMRTLLLTVGGLFLTFGSTAIGYEGAGPLGSIVIAFVAANGWDSKSKDLVDENFGILCDVFDPILFGLIGIEINLFILDGDTVGLGTVCLLIALVARIVASIAVAGGGNFNLKEKLFVSFAWLPKATVQAALGPVALDRARELHLDEYISYANTVMIIAVVSILLTAPLGGFLITFLGPRLLKKEETEIQRA